MLWHTIGGAVLWRAMGGAIAATAILWLQPAVRPDCRCRGNTPFAAAAAFSLAALALIASRLAIKRHTLAVGVQVGLGVGFAFGVPVGFCVGLVDGANVGLAVGFSVGVLVGFAVGAGVVFSPFPPHFLNLNVSPYTSLQYDPCYTCHIHVTVCIDVSTICKRPLCLCHRLQCPCNRMERYSHAVYLVHTALTVHIGDYIAGMHMSNTGHLLEYTVALLLLLSSKRLLLLELLLLLLLLLLELLLLLLLLLDDDATIATAAMVRPPSFLSLPAQRVCV